MFGRIGMQQTANLYQSGASPLTHSIYVKTGDSMKNIKINSSNIKNIYYDELKQELLVFFQNNSFYKYFNIKKEEVIRFELDEHKTKFIKSNFLNYVRVY